LLPLISYIGGGNNRIANSTFQRRDRSSSGKSTIVLIALDESQNAILSFGYVKPGARWRGAEVGAKLSSGFQPLNDNARGGASTPRSSVSLAKEDRGLSKYEIDWDLDPDTLPRAIDRKNVNLASTAKLPTTLKVLIFDDANDLPFSPNNSPTRTPLTFGAMRTKTK